MKRQDFLERSYQKCNHSQSAAEGVASFMYDERDLMRRKAYNPYHRLRNAFLFSNKDQAQNTALNLLERMLQRVKLRSSPFWVQVEVTNRCNLNCVFCSRHNHPLQLGNLSPDLLPEIVRLSRRSRELLLFGYGEPLISEAFYSLLRSAQSGQLSFTTNGLLLTEDLIAQIYEEKNRPIHHITFSIEGIHPQTYLSIRERSNFDRVWNNLQALSEYKVRHKLLWPEIWINFVAMRRNLEELPLFIEKAAPMGISQINIFHLIVWDESYEAESLVYYTEITKRIFSEAKQKARKYGIRLDLPTNISENHGNRRWKIEKSMTPKCYQPWSYTYIRHDGIVQACCFSEKLIMGNLREKSFEEIWNDEPYRMIRRTVNRVPPPDCGRCELRFRYAQSPNDLETYVKLQPRMK